MLTGTLAHIVDHVVSQADLAAKGVVFTDFKTAAAEYPHLVEKLLGQIVAVDEDKFSAMAAAFSQDGVLLYVPKGVEVDLPLHSVFWDLVNIRLTSPT